MAAPQRANTQSNPSTVVVKLRESLGSEILAALPPDTLTVTSTTPASARAKAFLTRHAVSGLRPLFPQFARARLLQGLSEAQVADQIRARFSARSRRAARILPPAGLDRIHVLTWTGAPGELPALVDQLNADPDVEYAELDHRYSVETLPNDPYLSSYGSWGQSYADLWGLGLIGAPAAWATSTGSGVTVAVIDTGIDLQHPDIIANLWHNAGETPTSTTDLDGDGYAGDYYGWNFADSNNNPTDHFGHGTHVAGTIAAAANNGIGVAGVAWGARVMAVKGLNDQGYGWDSTLAPALIYAANRGADVFNLSWGGPGSSQVIADAVNYAYSLGVVIVAAAGNSNIDATGFYPASLPQVITVSAVDSTGARANFSDFGPKIDVGAPGVDILSLQASGSTIGAVVSPGYMRLSGTSMATPHVAGLAALLLSEHPEYTNEQVRQVLRASASSAGAFNTDTGYGVIRSAQALAISGPLEAHITSPLNGVASSSAITVSGVARGSGFASYRLDYGSGAAPSSWTIVTTSASPASGGVLGTFDAGQLPNGACTIRLTAWNTLGAAFVDQVHITATTAAIATPATPRALTSANSFKPGGLMPITGTAIGSGFQSYKLEWSPGAVTGTGWQTSGITLTGGGTTPVSSGVLGTWDTSAFHTAGYYTLRLTVYRTALTDTVMTVVYLQPDLVSAAWPLWLDQGSYGGAVQVCSQGAACQLATASPNVGITPGGLWVMSMDGTSTKYQLPLPGYGSFHQPSVAKLSGADEQVVMADNDRLRIYTAAGQNTQVVPDRNVDLTRAPTPIADLTGSGTPTTLAFGSDWNAQLGYVYAWTGTGTPAGNKFPIAVQDQNPINGWYNRVRVIAADVDGDGVKEIVVSEGLSPTTFTLRLYSSDGTPRTWAVPQISGMPQSLAAADLDGNGKSEVVVVAYDADYATIHVFQPDGSERAGWPHGFPITAQSTGSYLAIGDLAQNGHKQIVWASTTLAVLNADGTSYSPAWPLVQTANQGAAQGTYGAVVLGDVDGDGKPEIVTTSTNATFSSNSFFVNSWYYDQKLLAFHLDGTIARSWQLTGMNGYDSYTSAVPSLGDFSGQGTTEIAVAYYVSGPGGLLPGVVAVFETGVPYNAAFNPWPYAYGNRGNNPVLAGNTPTAAITIQTVPQNLQFSVDGGAAQTAPQTMNLAQGPHTISVAATQSGPTGTQYVFTAWSDSSAASHQITVGSSAATYTATFQTQYQLTISASPAAGGTVTPASGNFYAAGTVVPITAAANAGFVFTGWTGSVADSSNPSTTITLNGPRTATASFSGIVLPVLSIAKTHTGVFALGQQHATYTLTVSNGVGAGATSGTVTATETPGSGLTLVSMAGTGWTCPAGGTTCTRSDVLAAGSSYPAITVTVNVSSTAASFVTNQAGVSGGGSPGATASDTATVVTFALAAPGSAVFGQPVTLTATFAGATGKVTFYDGVTMLGIRTLSAGTASLSTTLLPAGNRKLKAYYGGDSHNAAMSSNLLSLPVSVVPGTTFAVAPQITVGTNPMCIAVADFNGDGFQDLAVSDYNGSTLRILLGKGDGTFQSPRAQTAGSNHAWVAAGDLNGDGNTDLVVANGGSRTLSILFGNGDGTFQSAIEYPIGDFASSVAVGDFNGDGKADLVFTFYQHIGILLGNGDGTFRPVLEYAAGADENYSVVVGDFNGDGKADLAFANSPAFSNGTILVLSGNGDGTFQTAVGYPIGLGTNSTLVAGDLDADGVTDLAAVNGGTSSVSVLYGNGNGTFRPAVTYDVGLGPFGLAIGNFDNGAHSGLAVANLAEGNVNVLEGNFQHPLNYELNYAAGGPAGVAVGDFNGDGVADIAVAGFGSGFVSILLGASASLSPVNLAPQSALFGQQFSTPLQVLATDSIGHPISGIPVSFLAAPSSGASATLSSAIAVTNASGVAAVTATANNAAGSYSVVAQSGSVMVSFGLTNIAPVPAALTTTAGTPQSAAAGMPFPTALQATLRDSGGNPVSGAAISFSAPSTGASAILSATTAITNGAGIAYVLATANATQGGYTVSATFGSLTATFSLTNLHPTGVALSTSANPSQFGAAVSVNVSVTPSSAIGKVTFYDGTTLLGIRPLSSGAASLSTIMLPAGNRKLMAYYGGDSSNPASNSNVVTQTVNAVTGGSFAPPASSAVGSGPAALTAGDLNGDSKADLVVANQNGNSISVLLGDGNGGFGKTDYLCGAQPVSVAIGDFDGDGKPDVAVANKGDNNIAILLGNGNGTLRAPVTYATGSAGTTPFQVAVGDFNRDGKADLAIVNWTGGNAPGSISVLLGNGDGTFQPAVTWAAGLAPVSLAIGDLNGDGKPDIVVTNNTATSTANVLLGNGDGTFQSPVTYGWSVAPAFGPAIVEVEDFNGDGKPDVAVVSGGILSGNGNGTLQPARGFPSSTFHAYAAALGDFNGDGKTDIIAVDQNQAGVFLGNGDGTFQTVVINPAGAAPYAVVVADFNGDGRADAAVANQGGSVSILLGTVAGLDVSVTHSGAFYQGQSQAYYTITVNNTSGLPTSGTVTVAENVPAGLTLVSMGGSGWNCPVNGSTCMRSDTLAPGASYPPITAAVSVSSTAGSPLVNSVSVSGGFSGGATTTDVTTILSASPVLTSLVPATAAVNSGPITIAANGTNILSGASIQWTTTNGTPVSLPATFVSATQVQASLPANLLTTAGTAQVALVNPGGATSGSLPFVITGSGNSNVPALVSVAPNSAPANNAAFSLVANGSAFQSGASMWIMPPGGAAVALPATFTSGAQLQATVPSGLFSSPGMAQVAILNPGSVVSTSVPFVVSNPAGQPSLTSLSPSYALQSSGDFTLAATGSSFQSGASIWWTAPNGAAVKLPAIFIGASQLQATVPAALAATAGTAKVAVLNPDFGLSGAQSFPIVSGAATSIWSPSTVPGTAWHNDSAVTLGLKFNSDVSGSITGIRFYKGSGNNGTHIGLLYSYPAGTLLAQATFTGETASGWQQVNFPTPVAVTAGTTYVAAYFSTSGFAYDAGYFTSHGVDNAPLHALQSGASGPSGVYAYGASARYPAGDGNSSNYWADVVFSPSAPPVLAADLTIAKSHTGNFTQGQTGAAYTITVTNSGTAAASGTVTVTDTLPTGLTATAMSGTGWTCSGTSCSRSDVLVVGSRYPAITVTVNVAPNAPSSVTNTATVSGGGETNTANDTANDVTTIQSSGSSGTAASIWSPSTVPGTPWHTDSMATVGLKFKSDVSGVITGIRFYKGAGNNGSHVGQLWSYPAGNLVTQAAFTGETASGWQQVNFSGPVMITANTVYVAALLSTTGYAYDAGYFTSHGVDNAQLHALQSDASEPNGVYTYGFSQYPSNSGNGANYWVDVVFALGTPDLTVIKTHSGNFTQGQTGATYTIWVTNSGTAPTSGTVTVADTLPAGLTLSGMSGTGWSCGGTSCSRSDILAARASYPAITVTVNVASNAAASVTATATVSGGGESNTSNDTSDDITTISGTAPTVTVTTGSAPPDNTFPRWSGVIDALVSDSAGVADLASVILWFTPSFSSSPAGTCKVQYNFATAQVSLLNDAGTAWITGNLANTQCTIQAFVNLPVNSTRTLPTFTVSFGTSFVGVKEVWADATGTASDSGWQKLGNWTVPNPVNNTTNPITGSGSANIWQSAMQFSAQDVRGASDLQQLAVSFTPSLSANQAGTCTLTYNVSSNLLSLLNDSATASTSSPMGPPGATGSHPLQNSQCTVDTSTAAFSVGQTLYLTVAVNFGAGFTGAMQVWQSAVGQIGSTGWQQVGTWTVTSPNLPPVNVSVSPNSGNGAAQSFTFQYGDPNGLSALQTVYAWFASSSSPANSCQISYTPSAGTLALLDDAGTLATAGSPGTPSFIRNSQCAVDLSQSSVSTGTNLSVTLALRFTGAAAGVNNILMRAMDQASDTGFQSMGQWTVPTSSGTATSIFSATAVPGTAWHNDSAVTLGLKFKSDVSGNITGIRLYKGAGNNGTHIGLLYSYPAGTLLAQATFTGETASGWQQVNFATPVAITAGTTYVAAYFSASGFAYDAGYFNSQGVDNAPLHALQTGVSGSNGVYAYGASAQYPSNGGAGNYWVDVVFAATSSTAPDLTITKTHSGNFTQGQTGAAYTIAVSNSGTAATSGTVTVTDTLPAGLTATGMSGTGWTCGTTSCSRSDALAAGSSYPAITVTVNVASNAASSVTNTATVSGGGETNTSNDSASDVTTIQVPTAPDLTITKTHSGSFTQGQTGATYAITVSNSGTAASSGTVTVTDTLPTGLTATAMSGTGWTCSGTSCSRSDALAAGSSYPAITVTVNVASNAPSSVTNTATVSGGGETNTANDTANDTTTIQPGVGTATSIWNASAVPGTAWHSDPAVTLGLKFKSDVSGNITGIRFYKGAGNNGTHIGLLYSYPAGTLLAQATFTGETASGWQQVSFSSPVAITAGTTYVAAYFSTSGFAYDAGYFTSHGVDNSPLHGLQTGVSGPSGVYAYGASAQYPSGDGNGANYWVDVVFVQTANLTVSASGSSVFGAPVTITAAATPASATGKVTFYEGTTILGVRTLSAGAASLTTTLLPAGSRKLRAYYGGDSHNSAASSNVITQAVSVVAGTTFAAAASIGVGTAPRAIAVADFNGDGIQDLAVADEGGRLGILLGKGDGTFQSPSYYTIANACSVVAADFDGDGNVDLVVANSTNSIVVLLGNGDGTFQTFQYPVGSQQNSVAVADFNGDGKADIVAASPTSNSITILLGNGDGTFHSPVTYGYSSLGDPNTVAVGDFNSDGKPDLALAAVNGVLVLLGNGDGTFQTPVLYSTGSLAYNIAVGDFNGDGWADLAVTDFAHNNLSILLGKGDGTFQPAVNHAVGAEPMALAVGRFDGGATDELAVVNAVSASLTVLPGNLQTSFDYSLNSAIQGGAGIAVGDFNGDGRADLAVAGSLSGIVTILTGTSVTLSPQSSTSQSAFLGQPFSSALQVLATDASGRPVAGVPVRLTAPSLGASAALSATTVLTNASGLAAATATANNTAGSYSVTAQSGTALVSFSLTNVANVPASLTATAGTPQSAATGTPFATALQATLRDAGGNPVSGATVSFSAPSSGASATLSASTAVTNASGVAAVSATANAVAGAYTVTASAGPLTATFSLANMGVALSTSANPSQLGAPLSLNVTVTPSTATGKVTFYDGPTVLGIRTLASGSASLSNVLLPSGIRKLTAYYGGDASDPATGSNIVAQTVNTIAANSLVLASSPAVGVTPTMPAVADLNGDGKADLIVANEMSNSISVLLGNGNGTFNRADYPAGLLPSSVATGDFDGDGKPDVAVTHWGLNDVLILLGNGDGTLGGSATYSTGSTGTNPNQVVVADVNRDGKPDLVILNQSASSGNVSVLLGNGDGTFQPGRTWPAGPNPYSFVIGDLNRDGIADIIVSNSGTSGTLAVLLGNGDGTFQAPVSYSEPYVGQFLVGDLDRDGKPDVVGASVYIGVLRGNGDGTLQPGVYLPYNPAFTPQSGALGDFNGDGILDIVATSSGGTAIYLGNGDGSFQPAIVLAAPAGSYVVAADFNGDGRADAAIIDPASNNFTIFLATSAPLNLSATHSGNFTAGQAGVAYTLTVSNSGASPVFGGVSVTDTLPAGITATAIGGTGWTCVLSTLTCARADGLSAGGSYPAITVTVNVAANETSPQTNSAAVSSGGAQTTATDSTVINPAPVLAVAKTHTGNFTQGQAGAVYAVTVSNTGGSPTSGTVTLTENVPAGMTLVSMAGNGWTCGSTSCSRSDVLAAGSSYQSIAVTVNVSATAASPLVNSVSASGGGSVTATANDTTTIQPGVGTATSIWNASAVPGTAWHSDSAVTLGLKFKSDVNGNITGIRFYKGAGNNGTHIGLLYSYPAGALLAQATFTGETASGWQQMSFAAPVAITAGTTYVAALFSTSGFAWDAGYFNSGGVDNSPLHALQKGVSGPNGVYAYGTSAQYPSGDGNGANYWADVVFAASTPPPSAPDLTITSTHTGSFTQGQTGATYAVTASNAGTAATSGTVTVTDTLPTGLTATAMSGTGWTCSGTSCSRSDALAAGSSYPAITVTVNVAPSAPSSVTNTATVSGGGETNTANDTANDVTTIQSSGSSGTATSIWSPSTVPGTAWHSDSAVTLGLKFKSDVNGAITGIRFYKGSGNSGTHIGLLYSYPAGTLLAQATFTGETASGWQQVSFATPVVITAGTTYVAAYFSTSGFAWDAGYFNSAGVDNAPLHALQRGVSGPNGVYAYGTSAQYPSGDGNGANYWADVVFAAAAPDLTITSGHIGSFTQGQTGATYTLTVSNAGMAATSGTVTVTDTVPTGLTATAMSGTGWTCSGTTCGRSDALAAGSSYPAITVTVNVASNAPSSVTNTATVSGGGEANTANDTATDVTTVQASGPPGAATSIWSASTVPGTAWHNDSAVTLGLKFQSDVSGNITGIRFYKGAGNTGTHVGLLYSYPAGALLAQATFTGETASGWQQVSFATPVAITAGTTYVAAIFSTSGFAYDAGYFTGHGVDNAPLHALQAGASGPNGVYAYGAPAQYPSNNGGSANYWVDVVFSP